MMTGVGIVMPVFGRRMGELGGGVEELGMMLLAFAGAQLVLSPVAGWLADRVGRKPLILVALGSFIVTNLLYVIAPSNEAIILIRGVSGAFTAGLFPATLAIVGDTAPTNELGRWTGLVMGSYMAGFVLGPVVGGVLYDALGFAAPFLVSAGLGAAAFIAGIVMVPETLPNGNGSGHTGDAEPTGRRSLLNSLPRPLFPLLAALFVQFAPTFAFAFTESELVFHFYDTLQLTTVQFGIVVGAYGIAMVVGQVGLGGLVDRLGRLPSLMLGLTLSSSFYIGVPLLEAFWSLLLVAGIAGLGQAWAITAVGTWLLDLADDENRSLVSSLGSAAGSLAGVLGPAAIVVASAPLGTTGVFMAAGGVLFIGIAVVFALFAQEQLSRPLGQGFVSHVDAGSDTASGGDLPPAEAWVGLDAGDELTTETRKRLPDNANVVRDDERQRLERDNEAMTRPPAMKRRSKRHVAQR